MPALHDIVTKGSVDRSVVVHIMDSTDGTPETGVVFNTSGIDLWYRREGAARTAITEATLAALTTAHADGGFLHVSDGDYRLDLPDAAFATGANYVDFGGTVTGMIVVGGRVRLIDASLEVANIAANVTQISGDSTAADNLELSYDDTAGAVAREGIIDQGTAQSATSTTLVLRSGAAFADDEIIGATILITGGSAGVGQSRLITDYVSSTDTATVATWTTTPTGTITYKIFATAAASAGGGPTAAEIADAVWDEATSGHTTSGTFGEQVKTDIDAILVDTGTTLDGRIPAALVSGRMDASVGAMAANVLTATAINADAITAAKVAADVGTEIAAAVLTAAAADPIDANMEQINTVPIVGDGGATPFEV